MTVKLNSYINFDGTAREAMEFYKSIFGGELYLDTFGKHESAEMPISPEDRDKIMHAYLQGENGVEFMASDAPMGMTVDQGAQVSLTLNGDEEAVLRDYWEKLSEGAEITVPLAASPWGDTFGMLTDKYGIHWMVDISSAEDE